MSADPITRLHAALEGRYHIERELGEGGMATVYLADDLKHERKVALKVLKPELAAVLGAERFLAEIKTTANLQHPHILPLFDSGEADGFLFYVMPFVEGETLRERIDREHQLPVDDAVRIASDVAEALGYAHGHGVIHRDIKPANILIQAGRPVVADFGIALAVSAGGGHRLTETGLSLGTPHYVSPEQATGDQALGPASDIYSLGCVLYEMLVGEPPYTGRTAQAVLGRVITSVPDSVTSLRRAVPAHVDAVVSRALEKVPADRFASAGDFAAALGDETFRHGVTRATPGSRQSRVLTALGWVLATLFGIGFTMSLRPDPPPAVRKLSLSFPVGAGPSEWLELTPDGSALIMADRPRATGENFTLLVQRLDDLARVPIPDSRHGFDPAVSPDGQFVAFGGMEGLYLAPLGGGSVRTLVDAGRSTCCIRWGEDGFIYYRDAPYGIYRVPGTGGEPELVLERGEESELGYLSPVGDGSRAVFGSRSAGGTRGTIEWADLRTKERHEITEGGRPFLSDDGYLVFGRGQSIYAALLDMGTLEIVGSPVRMVDDVGAVQMPGVVDTYFTLSESGDLAYWVPHGEVTDVAELVWVGRGGEVTEVDPSWRESFESIEVSPDGTRAAVTVGQLDRTEIWIKDLQGGPARRLTNYQGMNRRPVWSPDGSALAFISDRDGKRAAYRVTVDAIGAPQLLLEHPVEDVDEVAWSSDGKWLVYRTGTTPGARDIYARGVGEDTTTIAVSALPDIDEFSPVLSPNGRWLAYASNEAGPVEVWVRPFPDVGAGSRRVSTGLAQEPIWSTSGQELFFRDRSGQVALEITDVSSFSTGDMRTLFANEGFSYFEPHRAHAYDGRTDRFLMIRPVEAAPVPAELILVQNFMSEVRARVGN